MINYRRYMQEQRLTEDDLPELIRQMIRHHEEFGIACHQCSVQEKRALEAKNQLAEQAILSAILDHFDEQPDTEVLTALQAYWKKKHYLLSQKAIADIGLDSKRRVLQVGPFLLSRHPFKKYFHLEKTTEKEAG